MKTQISLIPKYTIDLSTISTPAALMSTFKKNDIVAYVYSIRHSGMVLKFGSSMGPTKRCYMGERLYRQVGHSPVSGWDHPLTGANSIEFADICAEYTELTNMEVNKNNIIVDIFDLTKYPFQCDWNPLLEVERFEAELIDLYKQNYGRMPLGNKNPELHALKLNIDVTSMALQSLFDYVPQTIFIPA